MKTVIGILAHVDAGKTTLAEAILYRAGRLRSLGRVDKGDTAMDTHALERQRGITIFASEAHFDLGNTHFALLDTPGHVDFSAETERVLQVLDYAILVISGLDGVQAHTRTLWKLLGLYNVPTVVFVTKMDFARYTEEDILKELKSELDSSIVGMNSPDSHEQFAMCREDLLDKYLETGEIDINDIAQLTKSRLSFPCFFGSGLKVQGVDEFLETLKNIVIDTPYGDDFSGRVFKISRDAKGERLTHIKVTGGTLKVRDSIGEEKISQIRLYSGGKYETVNEVTAGMVCALTGLSETFSGQGLGTSAAGEKPYLEPVMTYNIELPEGADPKLVLPEFKVLEEEDPQLRFVWDSHLQTINVSLMGQVQTEILRSIVKERFDLDIGIGAGKVMYKETIENTVEGVGHYEPLRHYAEVHLILEPLKRGAGLVFDTKVHEDDLDRNWQRLILMHLGEKTHLGVLTGSPIADMKITLAAGRAHLKHTEGGDFRQSTYRAIRQGLMQAKSILLEPYYSFIIEVPPESIGRAINDVRARHGTFEQPEESGEMFRLKGRAPVTTMEGYAAEVASYTGGRGRYSFEVEGYDICHNQDEVVAEYGYDPEADLENTPDSVFCAHGGGFGVKWNEVKDYMHLESCLKEEKIIESAPRVNKRNLNISDKELEEIMLKEFGPIRRPEYGIPKVESSPHRETFGNVKRKNVLIIDGYNVIFAWESLKAMANSNLDLARTRLMDLMSNYSMYMQCETILVFDAYLVPGGEGSRLDYHGIKVVYTKENETGDAYIEKLLANIGRNDRVRVITGDGLIQLAAWRQGVMRMSAREFEKDVDAAYERMRKMLKDIGNVDPVTFGEKLRQALEKNKK